jgi:hypothetical protein
MQALPPFQLTDKPDSWIPSATEIGDISNNQTEIAA